MSFDRAAANSLALLVHGSAIFWAVVYAYVIWMVFTPVDPPEPAKVEVHGGPDLKGFGLQ